MTKDEKTPENIKILFVDDNPDEFVLMEWICNSAGGVETELICVANIKSACETLEKHDIDIILLDNKLHENDDFRTSVPVLRSKNFVGPIGIVSSSIAPDYFQEFEQYGADFRIGKNELDKNSFGFILEEFASGKNIVLDD